MIQGNGTISNEDTAVLFRKLARINLVLTGQVHTSEHAGAHSRIPELIRIDKDEFHAVTDEPSRMPHHVEMRMPGPEQHNSLSLFWLHVLKTDLGPPLRHFPQWCLGVGREGSNASPWAGIIKMAPEDRVNPKPRQLAPWREDGRAGVFLTPFAMFLTYSCPVVRTRRQVRKVWEADL